MPAKCMWNLLQQQLTVIKLEYELDKMKNYSAYTTQSMRCQLCAVNLDNHYMGYRIIQCKSSTCGDACDWYAKILTCTASDLLNLYHHGYHTSLVLSPPRKKMKLAFKRFVKDHTRQGVRPARIQAEMVAAHPRGDATTLPSLCQIQRLSYHFRKSTLMEDALVDHMNKLIGENLYSSLTVNGSIPFVFGYSVTVKADPKLATEATKAHFLLGSQLGLCYQGFDTLMSTLSM